VDVRCWRCRGSMSMSGSADGSLEGNRIAVSVSVV
jgi:hypothetical protein